VGSAVVAPIARWADLGRVEYGAALRLQEALLRARAAGAVPDCLLLLEHPPVVTLGRRGSRADILIGERELAARGIGLWETNRGGLVTYHGPGQLVGYVIADLRALTGGDVVRYVSGLEETVIRGIAEFGVEGRRHPEHRGVWVGEAKIGAVGVAISRGVTMHGFAVNLQPDLGHFTLIRPCGMLGCEVTSVAALRSQPVPADASEAVFAAAFGSVFDRDMVEVAAAELWDVTRVAGALTQTLCQ
jgi:lipoate-protein ligase B